MAAPEGSFTCPAISPVFICPNAEAVYRMKKPMMKIAVRERFAKDAGSTLSPPRYRPSEIRRFANGDISVFVASKISTR
jgi:hypothetical protein